MKREIETQVAYRLIRDNLYRIQELIIKWVQNEVSTHQLTLSLVELREEAETAEWQRRQNEL